MHSEAIGQCSQAPVHWWNQNIDDLRRECLKARRIYQRRRRRLGKVGGAQLEDRLKALRKSLATAIKAAKEKCWADLIAMVDADVWGKPYKVVMRRLKGFKQTPGLELPGRKESIISALFPTTAGTSTRTVHQFENDSAPFSVEDVLACAITIPSRKAPGPDRCPTKWLRRWW